MAETTPVATEKKRRTHRRLVERYVITGALRLTTPAHFGNGETDSFTDMPLLKDELEPDKPLLPGSSIAGALRSYLREYEAGYWRPLPDPIRNNSQAEKERFDREMAEERKLFAGQLFGDVRSDDGLGQSHLIVHDALGQAAGYELRDGVRIEPETRTAEDEKKYDTTLLAAGSKFALRFDLLIGLPEGCTSDSDERFKDHRNQLLKSLATALNGLAAGEITLGARKRRGFGRCRVTEWAVRRYNLLDQNELLAWLAEGRTGWAEAVKPSPPADIKTALGVKELLQDNRRRLSLNAKFALDGSLLVRSGRPDEGPDMAHLQSWRPAQNGKPEPRPIIAGTSWAGVLRSRATQIAHTLATNGQTENATLQKQQRVRVADLIERVFGPADIRFGDRDIKASRIEVAETEVGDKGIKRLEQTRIKIDRFTGGAFESALFSEEPLFGNQDSRLTLELTLRLPDEGKSGERAEIGLLLLLLKDLWTGDLPIGGESAIGRGQLRGVEATIKYNGRCWKLNQTDSGKIAALEAKLDAQGNETSSEANRDELDSFVAALVKELRNG
ncbi:MAG: hypothetical protein JNJ50_19835 [Acidobacteria bacterium]|nr:hypothetical protein [Acidobacteriota bacterium]